MPLLKTLLNKTAAEPISARTSGKWRAGRESAA